MLTIVTAADIKYWRSLYQFLLSAERVGLERDHRFIAYDLGLGERLDELTRRFPWVCFRRFDFENYPPHLALEARTYAWKPVIVADVMAQSHGYVLWLDSATILKRRDLNCVIANIARDGIYALKCDRPLAERCDPLTLAAMNVPLEFFDRRERANGLIGLDSSRQAVRDLVMEWRRHALIEAHIAPRRPPLSYHKPEQSLLTILMFKYHAAGKIGLTDDEIDIASRGPVRWMSSRNKLSPGTPLWADPFCRIYYLAYKTLDRWWLRFAHWRKTQLAGLDRFFWEHFTVYVRRDRDGRIVRIRAPRSSYYADPFIWAENGQASLFVEEYRYSTGQGRLCAIALDEDLRTGQPQPILPLDVHCSYPLLFKHDKRLYLLPETSANNSVDLYVCEKFPDRWRLERRLLYGVDAADTTIFEHHGRWWIITSLRETRKSGRYLAIYSTGDLLSGEWTPHPVNSEQRYVGLPNSSYRNAGHIVRDGDRLLRVVQYNPRYYGESARMMRIETLTQTEFREEFYSDPHPLASILKVWSPHHVSRHDGITAWDVRDRVGYWNRAPKRAFGGEIASLLTHPSRHRSFGQTGEVGTR